MLTVSVWVSAMGVTTPSPQPPPPPPKSATALSCMFFQINLFEARGSGLLSHNLPQSLRGTYKVIKN